ncbi:MAG: hypothetical protein LCH56_12775 [Proteobacteria bacterium]|nr:hypothetical protein [Pseudomonadota bacterium]
MYHYETLGDERFQELCQALITAAFPDAQCLPVGQPDGGRDAFFIRHAVAEKESKHTSRDVVVFQVKYVKNPADTRIETDFLQDLVKKEKAKIEKLKLVGLSKYYLLTNLKGSAHPGVGSIDRLNEWLSKELTVEAHCWWRDDLDRRLDGTASVKWSYPEVLKATDLLHALVHGLLGEDEERRRGAMRAYMTVQYEDDQELRFKQTELRSTMTELFVDLPMRRSFEIPDGLTLLNRDGGGGDFESNYHHYAPHAYAGPSRSALNSAEFFAGSAAQELSRIVLEGAPGQGKSTVTQFTCQVMRMRLLNKQAEFAKLPKQFHHAQVRIPFRVDLRDFAKWMAGTDPFQSKPVALDVKETKSLEGFLAAQVRYVSGGHNFNVSDLTAVARASHILLALDGFDEVADVELRRQLVSEITKGSHRLLSAGGYSVQTIVTSRPAAFAKSIRFPREQWTYFELLPLERSQVDSYTGKWMRAKGVKEAEQDQLRRILEAKLREAHTQYLAKNPMQLTILLSLIHNRGASLPEKRTAMYDAYMDLFFSRESEKSDVVRDNRDLLVDIHRYLAWKLQTAAEAGENGSIEHSALRAILLLYLDTQGEDPAIVGELFNGIIERVGALVSRVQDTYEFEVQPLREYFAARHLYETAPYSPAGNERSGTKLDRFNALVRNPYWLNVARFYGGCFSKGEISALADEFIELAKNPPYKSTSHPRGVAMMLLADWVFTQYQPAVRKVISFVVEPPHLRQMLAITDSASLPTLPDRSGRGDFLDALWNGMVVSQRLDEQRGLASLIIQNSGVVERTERWRSLEAQLSHKQWIEFGSLLRIFHNSDVRELFASTPNLSRETVVALLRAYQFQFLEEDGARFELAQQVLLHEVRLPVYLRQGLHLKGRLAFLAAVASFYQYEVALSDNSTHSVRAALSYRFGVEPARIAADGLSDAEKHALEVYDRFLDTSTAVTATSIGLWVDLVEALRAVWGDCPAVDGIAVMAAGVRSKEAEGEDSQLIRCANLVNATRFARLKSGAPSWWIERLTDNSYAEDRQRWILLLWIWGTTATLVKLAKGLNPILDSLTEREWENLCDDFEHLSTARTRRQKTVSDIDEADLAKIKLLGSRVCMFLGTRVGLESRYQLAIATLESLSPEIPEVQFAMDSIIDICRHRRDWEMGLPSLSLLYGLGGVMRYGHPDDQVIDVDAAVKVSSDLEKYPLPLIAIADSHLKSAVGAGATRLLDIAVREKWFN